MSHLKLALMNILVKMVSEKELQELKDIFVLLDLDDTGFITAKELTGAVAKSKLNHRFKKQDIAELID